MDTTVLLKETIIRHAGIVENKDQTIKNLHDKI